MEKKLFSSFAGKFLKKHVSHGGEAPDGSHGMMLYLEGINKSFDGFKAINDLNLYIEKGELRCIIGPNGAGKSTMMDIITGKTRPDSGSAWFGQNINLLDLDEPAIAQAGIGRKFQKPTVFENMTVDENLELALSGPKTVWSTLRGKMSAEDNEMRDSVLELTGLKDLRGKDGRLLSHGQKQWLELGMLLMQKPQLLLVDEPVTGMTRQEMQKTAELLLSLEHTHTIIVVEHDMDFVRSIARKVTVLHQGHVLAEGSMAEVQANPKVVEVYLGSDAS
ncbi:MAG: urea ABC transporter ATP-binding protein UrtD [Succinivibrionaceae bacterium]|nr:urea ABC transporter ATP-binding protein UrtD [Pseudomonadota bacterium]MDD6545336.1 urea ABC transporter ATP-binding protein UrtD [Pseudomonadota bacterium]MDY3145162.1 urea ABC transporter ATP-binding protein UrtD [Succinivibrionaceae bacterium]MDY6275688.1 urea ABC transporter ATP-binding protein UrtD [Succinivibrionaceae bacterium]MDY6376723.1 urea ABC transporter ATP-binding protein UrtD [Succinivibrionaceae bacterium]